MQYISPMHRGAILSFLRHSHLTGCQQVRYCKLLLCVVKLDLISLGATEERCPIMARGLE